MQRNKPPPTPPCQGESRAVPPLTRGGWEGLGFPGGYFLKTWSNTV
jgi:hypothetical protein